MYFGGKLVYLIVRASNQLAVKAWQVYIFSDDTNTMICISNNLSLCMLP